MNEEEIRKMLNTEIKKEIKLNLDSALIFTYVQALEKENAELKQILRERYGYMVWVKKKRKQYGILVKYWLMKKM